MAEIAPCDTILLHVEATEQSITAAWYAIALAKIWQAELYAVYVANEQILEELLRVRVFLEEESMALTRDLEEDGKHYLAFVTRLAHSKKVNIKTELLKGIVHRQVVDKAREIEAGLVALGEIEPSTTASEWLYNESEQILNMAECPVLIVKGAALAKHFFDSV